MDLPNCAQSMKNTSEPRAWGMEHRAWKDLGMRIANVGTSKEPIGEGIKIEFLSNCAFSPLLRFGISPRLPATCPLQPRSGRRVGFAFRRGARVYLQCQVLNSYCLVSSMRELR